MTPAEADISGVHCRLDELLAERDMTLTALSGMVGVSIVNLSVLKNDRAKAIRFSTLSAICWCGRTETRAPSDHRNPRPARPQRHRRRRHADSDRGNKTRLRTVASRYGFLACAFCS